MSTQPHTSEPGSGPRRRATPRAEVACAVTLTRRKRHGSGVGAPVTGETQDLGPGGMRICTERPLKVDEKLEFDLTLGDGAHVCGSAHVVRVSPRHVYALCIDTLAASADGERLWELATATG